jgi:hypothetical protein
VLFSVWMERQAYIATQEVDADTVTMAHYTVQVSPHRNAEWSDFEVGAATSKETQSKRLSGLIEQGLCAAIPGAAVAKIGRSVAPCSLGSAQRIMTGAGAGTTPSGSRGINNAKSACTEGSVCSCGNWRPASKATRSRVTFGRQSARCAALRR